MVKLARLSKTYARGVAGVAALHEVTLDVGRGEFCAFVGPSGCGKSTLLNLVGGLDQPSSGELFLDGRATTAFTSHDWTVVRREVLGIVFQAFHLVPGLTALENVALPLEIMGAADAFARAGAELEAVGLAARADHYPAQLSGGEQQRVALARALAPRPELILLDEPFSNLDVGLRERLSVEVREILKREGSTAIMVTHDQHEAFAMADEIGVMFEGRIQQWDVPYNLYHRPANRFVADFIGQGVLLPGVVASGTHVEMELGKLVSDIPIACSETCANCADGCDVDVLLRPDDVVHDDRSPLQAEVLHKAFRGADILYTLRLASGAEVLSLVPSHHNHAIGEKIGIRLDADHVIAFKKQSARAHV